MQKNLLIYDIQVLNILFNGFLELIKNNLKFLCLLRNTTSKFKFDFYMFLLHYISLLDIIY